MVLPSHFFKNFYAEKVNEIGCVYDELRLPCCGPLRCAPLFCRRAERTLIVKKHMKRNSILLTALLVIVVATLLVYGVFSASGTPPSDLSEMSGGASPGAASETGSTGSSQAPSDLPSESWAAIPAPLRRAKRVSAFSPARITLSIPPSITTPSGRPRRQTAARRFIHRLPPGSTTLQICTNMSPMLSAMRISVM